MWKDKFLQRILERGFNYYKNNYVKKFDVTENKVFATVIGSRNYEVEITFQQNQVSDMFCTCPHADDGNNCKHMAAVLYKYESEVLDNKIDNYLKHYLQRIEKKAENKNQKIKHLVSIASRKQLEHYATMAFKSQNQLLKNFEKEFICELKTFDFSLLKDEIQNTIYHASKYTYFDEDIDLYDECEIFAENNIDYFIKCGQLSNAFLISKYLFDEVSQLVLDDSFGKEAIFVENRLREWKRIYNLASEKLRSKIIKEVNNLLESDYQNLVKFEFSNIIV